MNHRTETLTEKKLIGLRMQMSLTENKTGELWKSFMPRRKEIQHTACTDLYSMQIYDPLYFQHFNPSAPFEKWAAMEVTNFDHVPGQMEKFILTGGLYAVFHYKGDSNRGAELFYFIFNEWLPSSVYTLDNRPHFELLGANYKNGDPDSEEEIWIPVKLKK